MVEPEVVEHASSSNLLGASLSRNPAWLSGGEGSGSGTLSCDPSVSTKLRERAREEARIEHQQAPTPGTV